MRSAPWLMARVMIVGAGPRGLACARTLRAAGHEVDLLEAGRREGGQARIPEAVAIDASSEPMLRTLGVELAHPLYLSNRSWPQKAAPSPAKGLAVGLRRLVHRATQLRRGSSPGAEPPPASGRVRVETRATLAALSEDLQIRIGWEALEVATNGKAASLLVLVPSGERRFEADAVVLAVSAEEALRLVPEVESAPDESRAAEGRARISIDFASESNLQASAEAWALDAAASVDLEEVLTLPSVGVTHVRFAAEAAVRLAAESDEVLAEAARKGLVRLPIGEVGKALCVHRWSEPMPPASMADFPGAVFWARSGSEAWGFQGALESGHRAGLEVASFLRTDD